MTSDERLHILELVSGARSKLSALETAIVHATDAEPGGPLPVPGPGRPPVPDAAPRAVLAIGTASAKKGAEATVELRLTCPEPIAGVWLNIRHSPKLTFLHAKSKVAAKSFRADKGENHFRSVLMFSTDMETESAAPGKGLVQLDPETLILEATYRLPADATPGQNYVVQAGFSGAGTPGVSSVSWPVTVLNWGSGGIKATVEDGGIQVIA